MKIYKISQHLNFFENTLGVMQIYPVWGKHMSANDYFDLSCHRVSDARGLLLPSELGCALAHVVVYKKIVASNCSGLIFESDINFSQSDLDAVFSVVKEIGDPDFINFAQYKHFFKKLKVSKSIYIAETSSGFWGASAYYLSHRAAKWLLDIHSEYPCLTDNWQEFFVRSKFIPYYSPIFYHDGKNSSIQDKINTSQNPSLKSMFRLRLLRSRMKYFAWFRLMRFYIKSKKL